MKFEVPERLYRGELVSYPGAWAFQLNKSSIIFVSDQELIDMATDPDKIMNLALGFAPWNVSLRQVCQGAQAAGCQTLIVAFDHFFSQYRPGQDVPRNLLPDMDEYVHYIRAIAEVAQAHGLGLELSLLSPLEVGPAYVARTGESGRWVHYRKGLRDPVSGAYSVDLWRQHSWTNNKGVVQVADAGVRVFAFREESVPGGPYRAVRPEEIVDISETAQVEVYDGLSSTVSRRIRVFGRGRTDVGALDRVLVVQTYRVPEMDYFSDHALPFLTGLIDKYLAAGIRFHGFYSDEMHIQQDWHYFDHHDHGQFAVRYLTPGLAKAFAERYGEQYRDLDKYLVYFISGQEDFAHNLSAAEPVQHVFGASPEDVRETALFRSRYYRLLQDGVVDLFVAAKRYAEAKVGYRIETRAHATWAESPTVDYWRSYTENMNRQRYEYTSNFLWSCTVHQAAAACHDYFKWGEFLTGTGNDHPEGGWLDRNYYGLALASSTGIINEVPYSYCAHWGHPQPVAERRSDIQSVYGAAGSPLFGLVQDMQHRDVDVLMLYPLDLVSVEERFGSWMTQYGYANLITQAKLLELGRVHDGAILLGGRRFTTLVALFEPFASFRLLEMAQELAQSGGRVIWSGPPPVLAPDGRAVLDHWQTVFGVAYTPSTGEGLPAAGKRIIFSGVLSHIEPQTILTDLLVDHIYPVVPRTGTDIVARVDEHIVGTCRHQEGGGTVCVLGFRPRDDQARSLGYETRTWFDVLCALGAYPPSGVFPGTNDNTEYLSRTTDYLVCRFPNGAIAVAPHLRDVKEDWPGGFSRKPEEDEVIVARLNLPSQEIALDGFRVNGHTLNYYGKRAVAFRLDQKGQLIAFAGSQTKGITVDGKAFHFGDACPPLFAWGPVPPHRRVHPGVVMMLMAHGAGTLRIPAAHLPAEIDLFSEGQQPGSRGLLITSHREGDALIVDLTAQNSGRWVYAVAR